MRSRTSCRQLLHQPLRILMGVRQSFAEVRRSREHLEAELFCNRDHRSSKDDDDLPIVR